MAKNVKIGLIQTRCSDNQNSNIQKTISYIHEVATKGAQIVCLQEVFGHLYFPQTMNVQHFELAEPENGPTIQKLSAVAKQHQIYLIVPIFEIENNHYYNTAIVLNPEGRMEGKYRKTHIPLNTGYQEKYYFKPGNLGYPVFKTPLCTFGISICWDHWFVETQRAYALQGCEIVFSPTALGSCNFAEAHIDASYQEIWETMLRGQCIQNGIFMAVMNRTGKEENIDFWGNSLVCDPKGKVIEKLDSQEGVLVADINLTTCHEWLTHQQFFRDR